MLPVSTEEFPFDERPPPACAEAAPQSSNSSRTVSKLFKLFTVVLTQAGQTRGVNRKHRGSVGRKVTRGGPRGQVFCAGPRARKAKGHPSDAPSPFFT